MCIRDSLKWFYVKVSKKHPTFLTIFLIFWCKFARRFLKCLGFGPPVSFQRKSSKNFTPFSSHFTKEKKTRIIARWRCLSKLHSKISLKLHSMRAPYKPSASLLGLSENASLGIFWPQKCTFCLTDPLFGSSSVAKMVKIGFNLFRKTLKLTPGRGRTWSVKLYAIFKYTL